MRRLPAWVVFFLVVLTVLMAWIGWVERDHVGPVPLVLGAVWALFTLGAARGMLKPETE
jgi:hypothetical protein